MVLYVVAIMLDFFENELSYLMFAVWIGFTKAQTPKKKVQL
jgi:hypothetical protein